MNNMLEAILKAETHQDVIELMLKDLDLQGFKVIHSELWTLMVPTFIDQYCPLLSAHTDTVHKNKPKQLVETDGIVWNPEGGLGADDRAGCYIIHELLKANQQYIYAIFDKEEVGGIGSKAFVGSAEFKEILPYTSAFIGLDRRGGSDCASYDYDNAELFQLMADHGGYEYTFGTFTDVMTLSHHSNIACCNLSIGYYKEHTKDEHLCLMEMQATLEFLMHYLPNDLWENQYIPEDNPHRFNKYTWNSYTDASVKTIEPIVCDICGEHLPLYDVSWGVLCAKCKHKTVL